MFNEDSLVRSHKKRGDIIFNIILFCFFVILSRLWYLQIFRGAELHRYSIENRLRTETLHAIRGMMFSRNNEILVHNTPRFDVILTPQYLRNKKETLKKLSEIIDLPIASIQKIIKRNRGQARFRPITIKKNISKKEVAIIETENSKMPGISVKTYISREYPDAEIGAHVLGYIAEISQHQLPKYRKRDDFDYKLGDFIGQGGLEKKFDIELRGTDGYQYVEVDARGRKRKYISKDQFFSGIENKAPVHGHNIRLTIDRDMQKTAYNALKEKVGSAVVVDVNTGELLTMVSFPSFDPSQFSKGLTQSYWTQLTSDERNPMWDRTIQEHYNPGSTYKPFVAIAALEEGIIDPDQEVHCGPIFKLGRRPFRDWKASGHGKTDLVKSLRESVDVYYYKIATNLDIDIISDYSRQFGMGTKTGVSLPREIPGLIPTKEWKKKRYGVDWQLGETVVCSIGQSFVQTTPLQLAMAYAVLANKGKLLRPYLIKEIFTNTGEVIKRTKPKVVRELDLKPETYERIGRGLYEVVNMRRGTAWWSRGRGIQMAGKTGTAQVRSMNSKELFSKCSEMPLKSRHHGLFTAYVPYENPKIAISIVVEHGCGGSSAAAPIARDIAEVYMKKYHPEEYKELAKSMGAHYRREMAKHDRKRVIKKKKEKVESE